MPVPLHSSETKPAVVKDEEVGKRSRDEAPGRTGSSARRPGGPYTYGFKTNNISCNFYEFLADLASF